MFSGWTGNRVATGHMTTTRRVGGRVAVRGAHGTVSTPAIGSNSASCPRLTDRQTPTPCWGAPRKPTQAPAETGAFRLSRRRADGTAAPTDERLSGTAPRPASHASAHALVCGTQAPPSDRRACV
jgi:hypothetical protein